MYFSIVSQSGLECRIGEIIPVSEFKIYPIPSEEEILISSLTTNKDNNNNIIFIGGLKEYKINGRSYPMGESFVLQAIQYQDSSISLLMREAIGKELLVLQGKDKKSRDHWWPIISNCNPKQIENENLYVLQKELDILDEDTKEEQEEQEEEQEYFY